ncbi:MAG: hypothetical protein JNL74_17340 [Fibrobacteres bacterium]|nr:hypothetical protein [Fibrobacterota bacterium]
MIPKFELTPAEAYQVARYKQMSYSEKYHMMMSLREFAVKVKGAGLRMQHPEWSEHEIKERVKEIFLNATT